MTIGSYLTEQKTAIPEHAVTGSAGADIPDSRRTMRRIRGGGAAGGHLSPFTSYIAAVQADAVISIPPEVEP